MCDARHASQQPCPVKILGYKTRQSLKLERVRHAIPVTAICLMVIVSKRIFAPVAAEWRLAMESAGPSASPLYGSYAPGPGPSSAEAKEIELRRVNDF